MINRAGTIQLMPSMKFNFVVGGVGQPLSLLLKCSPMIDDIALYDTTCPLGVAVDLSHINTKSTVSGFLPCNDGLQAALEDANIVFMLAGVHQTVLSLFIY